MWTLSFLLEMIRGCSPPWQKPHKCGLALDMAADSAFWDGQMLNKRFIPGSARDGSRVNAFFLSFKVFKTINGARTVFLNRPIYNNLVGCFILSSHSHDTSLLLNRISLYQFTFLPSVHKSAHFPTQYWPLSIFKIFANIMFKMIFTLICIFPDQSGWRHVHFFPPWVLSACILCPLIYSFLLIGILKNTHYGY